MIVDIFILMVAFYLAIPLVAGYMAKSYGRPFLPWFLFGCFLPAIAHFTLYFLVTRDIKRNKLKSLLTPDEIDYMDDQIGEVLVKNRIKQPKSRKLPSAKRASE